MTPQLQQAIRLLQLSTLELKTEVQEALDSNMMLEVDEDHEPVNGTDRADEDVQPVDIPKELATDRRLGGHLRSAGDILQPERADRRLVHGLREPER